jgi:hypothetical protein
MSEWGALNLQAAWFTMPRATDAASIFTGIVGAKPDSAQQMTVGSAVALGSNGVTQFQVQTQPGRVDYFEAAVPVTGMEIPLIIDLGKAISAFAGRVLNGSEAVGSAQRLAFVVTLCKPVESAGETLEILGSLVGASFPFPDASDLNFQINRRRAILGRDLSMNRLFRMQPQMLQQIDMSDPARPVIKSVETACISVDCNTHSSTILTLEPGEQIPIWKDLFLEAERLCDARSVNVLREQRVSSS